MWWLVNFVVRDLDNPLVRLGRQLRPTDHTPIVETNATAPITIAVEPIRNTTSKKQAGRYREACVVDMSEKWIRFGDIPTDESVGEVPHRSTRMEEQYRVTRSRWIYAGGAT